MGKSNVNQNIINIKKKPNYELNSFSTLTQGEIKDLRTEYKIIDVDWFDKIKVKSAIFNDEYFNSNPKKIKIVDDMVDYFHKKNKLFM